MRIKIEPAAWVGKIVAPKPCATVHDVDASIAAALARPIGSARLCELVQPGQKVAILVDDITRKTPVDRLLPPLLSELRQGGIADEHIAIVVALGTHRPLTATELRVKLGRAIADHYEVVNVAGNAPEHFTGCGEVAFDLAGKCFPRVEAFVNSSVLAANVRIGVGMITPHLDAGFSGGAKLVLPGVCSLATVDAFHRASAFVDENQLGNADAPLRRMLEAFVQAHAPLQFILNVVLHPDGVLHSCVAGDPVLAHRVGADQARAVYGVKLPQRYPVVVANAAPYDQDLWQSIKGAWAGDLATADGGTLILAAAAPEGNSLYPLVPSYAGRDPDHLQAEILAGAVEDAMQAATGVMWGRLRRRVRLVLVSPGLGPETAAAMGIEYAQNVQQAVDEAVLALPHTQRAGCVAVLPQAGVVLPVAPA